MAAAKAKICIELQDISIDFDHHCGLRKIDIKVEEHEIVSIIGPNGAGKTTLFNIICGQVHPHRGTVIFRGQDITRWSPHRICRAGIGRTFQIARSFPQMTALENVLIGIWFGGKREQDRQQDFDEAKDLLSLVRLQHKMHTPAKELTFSEQRRLEVARALGTKPDLLLLDEIAAGLSPQAIKQTVELVKSLRCQGLTLVLIDHFLNLTAKASDRLIAMDRGEIIVAGKPAEVLQYPAVAHAYLGETQP